MKKAVGKKSERTAAYIFVLPAVILLAAFLIYPALQTVRYAFTNYNIMRPDRITFCGLDNFIEIFQDKDFWKAFTNTLYFTVLVVPFQTVLALALALLISSRRKGVSIFRAAYFSPQVTSMVVVAILWTVMYNSNPESGLLNALLVKLGFEPSGFLNDPDTAMNSIIFMSAWQGAGYQMMIFLAGLQGIPRDQYEAASIDGASHWKQITRITLPMLIPTIILMLTLALGGVLNAGFDQVFNLYNPSVYKTGDIIDTYVYRMGLVDFQYSLSTAVGLMKSVVSFILIITSNYLAKKFSGYSMF